MKDEEFDALMRDAAHTWRRPPELKDADATWRAIERALPGAADARPHLTVTPAEDDATPLTRPTRAPWTRTWTHPWARLAAMLLVGVAIGRFTAGRDAAGVHGAPGTAAVATTSVARHDDAAAASPDEAVANEYLARTEALLASLPEELRAGRARPGDAAFLSQADALLLQTRLLLDSPAAADPALRSLLDDLEIVLAQVVRLDARRDPMGVDFLHQALEQRDVLPRLRDAVADNAAD